MRAFPEGIEEAVEKFANVVVRTDFSDEAGWQATVEDLEERPEDADDDFTIINVLVDDPAWAGASPDEVLAVVNEHSYLAEYLDVVMMADERTMSDKEHPVLIVSAMSPDDEMFDETTEFGREFRCLPRETHEISVNLGTGNMGFEEFAETAAASSDGVFRGFPD
ncbi:DUF6924 domain-containing protein [Paractinoplanes brasiliensis]|uniref:DUF6924 domain-containing protein n=1 Tax=Paractinoplanes brasiliensis TaxID=52695 RepID=A0A4R6JMZ6_9ACTN|nr:hypothetical protein [Actinoplanes brasiliensis]TDO37112.1 hypothetical protein C8E87_0710 [Actinoplanes brasiliensis]GID32192.1 hypothetical protein Abr02nite_71750 [Actinoplanes brasiliensis]